MRLSGLYNPNSILRKDFHLLVGIHSFHLQACFPPFSSNGRKMDNLCYVVKLISNKAQWNKPVLHMISWRYSIQILQNASISNAKSQSLRVLNTSAFVLNQQYGYFYLYLFFPYNTSRLHPPLIPLFPVSSLLPTSRGSTPTMFSFKKEQTFKEYQLNTV